jgi:hypothetical protein
MLISMFQNLKMQLSSTDLLGAGSVFLLLAKSNDIGKFQFKSVILTFRGDQAIMYSENSVAVLPVHHFLLALCYYCNIVFEYLILVVFPVIDLPVSKLNVHHDVYRDVEVVCSWSACQCPSCMCRILGVRKAKMLRL